MLEISPALELGEMPDEIDRLHQKCGVYTKTELVEHVLDLAGWTLAGDLVGKRLLEPSAGDGQFVVVAARRLIASCRAQGKKPTLKLLSPVISAFELHPIEASKARANVRNALVLEGLSEVLADQLVARWIKDADFLLSSFPASEYTHVVGNPPYVRWSTIPLNLRRSYESALAPRMARGDLFLPFLDKGIELLATGGKLAFVCSDRWKYMAFAEQFRQEVLPGVNIEHDESVAPGSAYLRKVDAYASIAVLRKLDRPSSPALSRVKGDSTLAEAGYVVKVGPALGCTPAFVIAAKEVKSLEKELLAPWLDGTEVQEGSISWTGRMVLCLYDDEGRLRNINDYPKARTHMLKYKERLELRSITRAGAPWYRPIDKVQASMWKRPKILVPELAKVPRVALDESGAVPSHGVYAIFAPNDNLDALYSRLRDGGLNQAIANNAPRIKGGYVRCYRRFLDRIIL
jgi:hypothetical protein